MDDLISKQDAIEVAREELESGTYFDIPSKIESLPSAQLERKKGKWILHENQRQEDIYNDLYLYVCSECGKSDIHAETQEVPFCWWCGSEMREEYYD